MEGRHLSEIAMTQPQAVYAALTHGLASKWTYLARTTPNIDILLAPLKQVIRHKLLPAITGQSAFSDTLRDLMALPAHLGGLGIIDPSHKCITHLARSQLNLSISLYSRLQSVLQNHEVFRLVQKIALVLGEDKVRGQKQTR